MEVVINALLSKWQKKVYRALRRFNLIRAGRRTGKTYLATYALMRYALEHPGSLCWFVALDISTCNELAIPEFERLCPPELIKHKNKQTRTYTLINGSVVSWKTAESADALRGRGVDFVVLEEAAFWKNGLHLWNDVLSPQLMGRGGRALFISSPNGSNWFRRLETEALADIKAKGEASEWAVVTGTIYENDKISREEIESKRVSVPELTWKQEYLAEYVDQIGQVYWQFKPGICKTPLARAGLMTLRSMDWGLDDNTACTWLDVQPGNKVYVFDEHVANNLDIPSHARIIHAKSTNIPIHHTMMDASAWRRESDMSSVAKRFGMAGIPLVQASRDFDGTVSDVMALMADDCVIIHPECKNILRAIEDWQHGSHEPDVLAAMRYGIAELVHMGRLMPRRTAVKQRTFADIIAEKRENAKLATSTRPGPFTGLSIKVHNKISDGDRSWLL